MKTALHGALAFALAAFISIAAACEKDEVLVGEDAKFEYCMKIRSVQNCKSKGGDVTKCVRAACVGTAGVQLKQVHASCKTKNETCLHERGAPSALVDSISGCIVGTVATGNLGACFASTAVGSFRYDTAVNLCKAAFGDCMGPGLQEHKNFTALCNKFNP